LGLLFFTSVPTTRTHNVINELIPKAHDRCLPPAPIERPPAEWAPKFYGRRWDIQQYCWMLKAIAWSLPRCILVCALNGSNIERPCQNRI
jgi:hypothetical protein